MRVSQVLMVLWSSVVVWNIACSYWLQVYTWLHDSLQVVGWHISYVKVGIKCELLSSLSDLKRYEAPCRTPLSSQTLHTYIMQREEGHVLLCFEYYSLLSITRLWVLLAFEHNRVAHDLPSFALYVCVKSESSGVFLHGASYLFRSLRLFRSSHRNITLKREIHPLEYVFCYWKDNPAGTNVHIKSSSSKRYWIVSL